MLLWDEGFSQWFNPFNLIQWFSYGTVFRQSFQSNILLERLRKLNKSTDNVIRIVLAYLQY